MTAYVSYQDNRRVIIRADGSSDRRSRGARVGAAKRAWEAANPRLGKLTRYCVSYSETYGFLSRTEVAYRTAYGRATINETGAYGS
jgi:hypothetical protein